MGSLKSTAAGALAAMALVGSACGGETGGKVEDAAKERGQKEFDRASKGARQEGAERAKKEIDRLEKEAKRQVKDNAEKEIERAADRARREVDKQVK